MHATFIGALSSTKKSDKARDPEMHQTRKGQQWYFGMKLTLVWTAKADWPTTRWLRPPTSTTSIHCVLCCTAMKHVYGDWAYASQRELIASKASATRDFTNQRSRHAGIVDEAVRSKNRNKSRIRSRVEHVVGVVKRLWGFYKVRYRGLQKNATRAFTALSLANIYQGRQRLLVQDRP